MLYWVCTSSGENPQPPDKPSTVGHTNYGNSSALTLVRPVPQVHLNPRVIDCPFMVDLAFPEQLVTTSASAAGAGGAAAGADAAGGGGGGGAAAGRGGAAGGAGGGGAAAAGLGVGQALTGNTYELGSGSLLIPLMKDDGGAMRVQVGHADGRRGVRLWGRRHEGAVGARGSAWGCGSDILAA